MALRASRRFRLQTQARRFVEFEKGQAIPDEHADHWYVRENSETVDDGITAAPQPQVDAPTTIAEPPLEETPEELAKDAELAGQGVAKESLVEEAKALGITVDGRWGMARLQAEIDKALAA